ncbi:MAG: sugar ABC transporter substrate-binding protein [Candidatus Atribacteria bacterium]|nr:sugar ABC transporter substrate-binding protein [Candidatus Atribacteria bacterium]
MRKLVCILLIISVLIVSVIGFVFAEKSPSDLHVALLVKNLVDPFFVYMKYGGQAAANKYGVQFTCLVPEKSGDVEAQIRIMEDLIQKGVDAIVLVPVDSRGIVSGIESANKAGVPIFVANTRALGGEFMTFAGIDHTAMARAMGKYVVEKLGGKGKIIQLEGKTGAQSSINRSIGFKEVFSNEAGIEILAITPADYDKAKAMAVMEDLLVRFPNIDAVIGYDDGTALGAIEAIKMAGRLDEILVTGTDAIKEALASIQDGELTATVDGDPFNQAFVPVEAAIQYLLYGKVPPKEIIIGGGSPTIIDKNNVNEFLAEFEARLKKYNVKID